MNMDNMMKYIVNNTTYAFSSNPDKIIKRYEEEEKRIKEFLENEDKEKIDG